MGFASAGDASLPRASSSVEETPIIVRARLSREPGALPMLRAGAGSPLVKDDCGATVRGVSGSGAGGWLGVAA